MTGGRITTARYNRGMSDEDQMDVPAVIEHLNQVLTLQHRSVLEYTIVSASLSGFQFVALSDRLTTFATSEVEDARLLVEKVVALDGEPTTEIAPMSFTSDPASAISTVIENETELVEALKDVIAYTGQEGRSEALEHVLEHVIMRKQNQIDFLLRASREHETAER